MKIKEFLLYLQEQMTNYRQEEKALILSERKDEANLAKIKANMCGICTSLYQVASKREDCKEEFLRLVDKLCTEWKENYEKAKEYQDVEKILIEETKLATMEELKKKFLEVEA